MGSSWLSMTGIGLAGLVFIAVEMFPASAAAQTAAQSTTRPSPQLREGDVLARQDADGWSTIKIIAVDLLSGGKAVVHCLSYRPVAQKPQISSLPGMQVLFLHTPISATGFDGWERIGDAPVTKDEAAGFVQYLKLTDFRRYATYTGQDAGRIISAANGHYSRANTLSEAGQRLQAIAEYEKAIDLFPLFYEAIDNRAFTYMELGRYDEALTGFEHSLSVNPDGVSAFFSKGECLMKLGKLDAAEAIFSEGQTRFPEKRALFARFLDQVRRLRQPGD